MSATSSNCAEKLAYLHGLGVHLVSTNKDAAKFMAEMRLALGSKSKLAVVLNSWTQAGCILGTVSLLSEGSWCVETGHKPSRTAMAVHKCARYIPAMLNTKLDQAWQQASLLSLSKRASALEVCPLPVHVFELQSEGIEAFRLLQRGNHVGNVAVSVCSSIPSWHLHSCCSNFVVSGGTGALGLLMGQWLLQWSAGFPVLLSRSGVTAPGAEQTWKWLAVLGTGLQVNLRDVGVQQHVYTVAECVDPTGILHSAGLLVDALLPQQTQAGLRCVWAPKASGAWTLHQASADRELEVFGLLSSAWV